MAEAEKKDPKKEKGKEGEPEAPSPKTTLLSGKGIGIILVLLAIEGAGFFAIKLFTGKTSDGDEGREAGILRSDKIRTTLVAPENPDAKVTLSIEYSLQIDSPNMEVATGEIKKWEDVIRAKVLMYFGTLDIDKLGLATTKEDMSQKIARIHNETLREMSLEANQHEMGEDPVKRVWIRDYSF